MVPIQINLPTVNANIITVYFPLKFKYMLDLRKMGKSGITVFRIGSLKKKANLKQGEKIEINPCPEGYFSKIIV